jgi:hypothetical protein
VGPFILAGREEAGCEGFAGKDTATREGGDTAGKRFEEHFSKETRVRDKEDL